MNDEIIKFINDNIKFCINKSKHIKCPFSVPCAGEGFTNFYYWDTYFTNFIFLDYDIKQVQNNLSVMRHFIRKSGFIPNIDIIKDRSQPPFYTRAVYDYYVNTNDIKEVEKNYSYMIKEYNFWMKNRITPVGLNRWYNNGSNDEFEEFYNAVFVSRLNKNQVKTRENKAIEGLNLLAIAESGWDFNPRFKSEESDVDSVNFAPVDLNCILYDVEKKLKFFSEILNRKSNSKKFADAMEKRKKLIIKYLRGKDGIYYDYNYVKKIKSEVLSVASVFPFAVGIDSNVIPLNMTVKRLKGNYGIYTCEYNKNRSSNLYQWDYPNMWPPMVYFVVESFLKTGQKENARKIAFMYLDLCKDIFNKTGNLWEKYNVKSKKVAVCPEYKTPPMLGWTAGVYVYCKKLCQGQ